MEQSISRAWLYVAMGAMLILALRWVSNHWLMPVEPVKTSGYSYEMPRPKSYVGSFDLSDREVDREILSDEEIKEAAKKDKEKAAQAQAQVAAKKNAEDAAKKAAELKKKFEVEVVDTSLHTPMSTSGIDSQRAASVIPVGASAAPAEAAAVGPSDSSDTSSKRSAAEWLSLLSTAPTAALIAEFEQAHSDGDVSNADFYNVSFSLLSSSNQQEQTTGTTILSGDTGTSGFTYLAAEYEKVSSTLQSTLMTDLQTYSKSGKFAGLNAGLASSTPAVVTLALKVLATAIQSAQTITTQGTGSRTVAGSSASSLEIFETNLENISKATGAADAPNETQAQTLLKEIQQLNPSPSE